MSLQPRCYFCDVAMGFRLMLDIGDGEEVCCCEDCRSRIKTDERIELLKQKLASTQEALQKLRDLALRAVQSSVPYLAKHGSFLIDAEAWRLLAGAVIPEVAALDVCLQRLAHGERPTEHEIEAALGKS